MSIVKVGITIAGNKSPRQLFAEGAMELRHSGQTGLDFFEIWTNRMV